MKKKPRDLTRKSANGLVKEIIKKVEELIDDLVDISDFAEYHLEIGTYCKGYEEVQMICDIFESQLDWRIDYLKDEGINADFNYLSDGEELDESSND